MNEFGYKILSIDNWRLPDPIMSHFVKIDGSGQVYRTNDIDWVQAILDPKLDNSVPEEMRSLFEVARGSMVYGYFFYPLFTLSTEQLFRVAEAAIAYKCKELNTPKSLRNFQKRIKWLLERGVIAKEDEGKWESARNLRNATSHPTRQMILTPGDALQILSLTAERINALFNKG